MKRTITRLSFCCITLLLAPTLTIPGFAQSPTLPLPPPVLNIMREEVKAGRSAGHESLETGYRQAFLQAKLPTSWLGMATVSGPNEAWFLAPYASFDAMEKERQEIAKMPVLQRQLEQLDQRDAEFRAGQRTMLAVFHKGFSYHPERVMTDLPRARYFHVLTVRMRPGRNIEFNQMVRMYLAAMEKANITSGSAAYQVISGVPGGTYLIFTPMRSLAEFDAGAGREQAINAALGAEDGQKLLKLLADSLLTSEETLFAFSPKMSLVAKEFAAGDPDFWAPKATTAAKPAAPKKQVAKASVGQ